MNIPYIGKAEYCYANSAAMALSSINDSVEPEIIEVLTGVGLGAFLTKENLLFFSQISGAPDTGLTKALTILGFTFEEGYSKESDNPPFEKLREILKESPVVLGPLDMGFLRYNPRYKYFFGADHFITAYKIDNDFIYLHDPWGFPSVFISLEDFKKAWKAENVVYRKKYYRYWTKFKRIKTPTKKEIYNNAILFFQNLYKKSEELSRKHEWIIGSYAIIKTAKRIKNKTASQLEIEQLTYFALPLGAKRALDYEKFFEPFNKNLADLKNKQAELFGESQSCIMRNDLENFYKSFKKISEVEEDFRIELFDAK